MEGAGVLEGGGGYWRKAEGVPSLQLQCRYKPGSMLCTACLEKEE